MKSGQFSLVITLFEAALDEAERLVQECRKCVKPGLLYLHSEATETLCDIRESIVEVEKELRGGLEALVAELHDAGISPERQVVFRRER